MAGKLGVLIIHGIGSQKAGYSSEFRSEVAGRLGDAAADVEWQEVHWAPALSDRETALFECMQNAREPDKGKKRGKKISLDWKGTREFIVHNFGDATAYQRVPRDATLSVRGRASDPAYHRIHRIVDASIGALNDKLGDPDAPIVVAAHSLGGHIMSNYLWDRQHPATKKVRGRRKVLPDPLRDIPALAGMITFGCNIPLFSLAFPTAKPIDLPGKAIKSSTLRDAVKWLNFLDRDDVLGWPLRPLYEKDEPKLNGRQRDTLSRVEDWEINVGWFATSWNPGSHEAYWTDNDFTKPVAGYLKTILAAA